MVNFLIAFIFMISLSGCYVASYKTMSFPVDTNPKDVHAISKCYMTKAKLDFYTAETVMECVDSTGAEIYHTEQHTDIGIMSGLLGLTGMLGFVMGTAL